MGHVQVHQSANTLAHPGHCHDCGYSGADRAFFVDTGINTEWDGFIIICEACLLNLVVKAYGFNPFDLIKLMELDKKLYTENHAEDKELLTQVKQGLAILDLTTTSLIRLAGFVEEESDGTRGSTLSVSSDQGAIDFYSIEIESGEDSKPVDRESGNDDSTSSSVDSSIDVSSKSSLGLP